MQQYIGKRLGGYQIVEPIGQGGMASVFKAYQPSMDRYVAIKILPSHFTEDKSFVGRFAQEARTLARLEHPHILPVHDHGEQDGITYLVMRYVEAGTLKDLIDREGALELKETARILHQVGRALDYAHSQGVVHRDIKPSNILIDERGDTFLTDFGIAKLVAETAKFTASGAILGTPAYISPEQASGEPLDHRCDIYALGIVLYEMVTGRVPFEAETPLAVVLKHLNDPLPLPRQIKPGLPEAVERVILKAVAKSPADRFQSTREMTEALNRAVSAAAVEVSRPQPPADTLEETARLPRTRPQPSEAPSPEAETVPPPARRGAPSRAAETPTVGGQAPTRRAIPWLPIGGVAVALIVVVIVALLLLRDRGEGQVAAPVPTLTAPAAPSAAPVVVQSPDTPRAGPTPAPGPVSYQTGWTTYGNGNYVSSLALQEDTVWAGGESGLVRWDLASGTYVKFGITDGLAATGGNDLLVDGEGALWVATNGGINRFDGETWMTFDSLDGLDSGTIEALFLDDAGGLWAGSMGGMRGLNYFDGSGWGAPPIPPLPVEFADVRILVGIGEGGLLAGLDNAGLALFDGEVWKLFTTDDGLPSHYVLDALWTGGDAPQVALGGLWVSFDQAVVRFDPETGEPETIPQLGESRIFDMHEASDGTLWFAGEDGVIQYHPDTGDWQEPGGLPDALLSRPVTGIAEGGGRLWFSTYGGGITFYDGSRWETWTTDDPLAGNEIGAIRQGADGALWFVHLGAGLSRYDPKHDLWQTFGEDAGVAFWPAVPAFDSEGNLWTGSYGTLLRYDGSYWESFSPPALEAMQPQIPEILAIEIGPDGLFWLATDVGLVRHDPDTDDWTTFTGADHPVLADIRSLCVSTDGTVWVGGGEALIRYDGSTWSTPQASGSPPTYIDDIVEGPDGSLWVAADGELYHLADGRWDHFAWPSEGWMQRVAVGPDGSVWGGGMGLGRLDPASRTWQLLSPGAGRATLEVLAIHVTPEGVVWIGTGGGAIRYVPPE